MIALAFAPCGVSHELTRFRNPYSFNEREGFVSAEGEWFEPNSQQRWSKSPQHVEVFFSREHGVALLTTISLESGWVSYSRHELPIAEWTTDRIKTKRLGIFELTVDRATATVSKRYFEPDGTITTHVLRK